MPIRRRQFLELGAAAVSAAAAACRPRTSASPPVDAHIRLEPLAGKVEHFIVLMMENRSYDQMLGCFDGDEHDGVPPGARLPCIARDGKRRFVPIEMGSPPDSFFPDPGHGFAAVNAQIHSRPGQPADMGGFAQRFVEDHSMLGPARLPDYLTLYDDGRLPILQRLAKEYGVLTHWFSSLPSSTTPNRMFAHAGTSGGATNAGAYYARIRGRMIFDKLGAAETAWRVYYHDLPHLWLVGDAWVKAFSGHFRRMRAFEEDVAEDRLAIYSFLEPQYVVPPWSSQHPAGGVSHGERLIADVYNALASNPKVFAKSLLLVVYDEHGGFYDHVVPPGHPGWREQWPGIDHEVVRPDGAVGSGRGIARGYAFDTLGPRVPAVVVSPWIERGSVFGWKATDASRRLTCDHTSILATVGRMTGVWVDSRRAREATHLGATLTRTTPRDDYPSRLAFDAQEYRDRRVVGERDASPGDGLALAGPGEELRAAWRAEHGSASPGDMAEGFRALVEGG
jgi:phospholipase C